jgi:hypothetical protein
MVISPCFSFPLPRSSDSHRLFTARYIMSIIMSEQCLIIYSKAIPTPISAFSRRFFRSTLTILPLLIRANCPFSFAKVSVRGKLSSTRWPVRIGAVIGSVIKTPVLLILQLRPRTNLFASGIQTLTGQATLLRLSFRCSIKACIVSISLNIHSITDMVLSAMLIWID